MKVIGFIIVVLAAVALGAAFWGWLVMLIAGILYNEGITSAPLGFFPASFATGFLLSILLGGSAKASAN